MQHSIWVRPLSDEDGGAWLAEVPDLPGCMSDGETPEEAVLNVQDAIQEWIAAAAEMGREVPAPGQYSDDAEYSGRLSLRMPKSLHADLVRGAGREGVSVNQYVLYLLSSALSRVYRSGASPRDLGHAVAQDR
jgi:antitoxin HicB